MWQRVKETYDQGGTQLVLSELANKALRTVRRYQSVPVIHEARRRVLDREDLLETIPDDAVWSYGRNETVTIEEPSSSLPPSFEQFVGKHEFPAPFVCELSQATLVGQSPIAIDDCDQIVLESVENETSILEDRIRELVVQRGAYNAWRVLRFQSDSIDIKQESDFELVFPLVRHPSTNYYHWMLGYVEKVRALEQYEAVTGREPTVLVTPNPPSWVSETIELAGVKPHRTLEWTHDSATVDRLVLPSHKSRYEKFRFSPDSCRWIRERFMSNISRHVRERDWSDRVYVSRKDALDRRVINEAAVIDLLSDYGFQSYTLSELSVAEQAALFAQADFVIGPHGAGLVNILFGNQLLLIELLRADDVRYHYFVLSNQLDFDYEFLLCETKGDDITVDLDRLREILDQIDASA